MSVVTQDEKQILRDTMKRESRAVWNQSISRKASKHDGFWSLGTRPIIDISLGNFRICNTTIYNIIAERAKLYNLQFYFLPKLLHTYTVFKNQKWA